MDSSAAEEIVSSETVYRGRLINVKLVKVNISGKLYHREVVDHPGAVALIPILGEQIILIRQFRLAAGRFLYEVPAGTLKVGEAPEECAARELLEETGYRAGSLRHLFTCFVAPGYSTELIHFYLASELSLSSQCLDEDESIQVCPMPMERAVKMVYNNEIEDAKTIVGVMLLHRYLSLQPS